MSTLTSTPPATLDPLDTFPRRHLGSSPADIKAMLAAVGAPSMDELINQTIPPTIRLAKPLNLPPALGESAALEELRTIATKNKIHRSFIGMGYYGTITPPVILRNILENPGWYTQYTPYQAEISQGRLEALLNFQTMVADLTALPVANASMLDEATAAAEAMHMCHSHNPDRHTFFVSDNVHPQTIAVVKTRAKWLGIEVEIGDPRALRGNARQSENDGRPHSNYCGILVQYPGTDGRIEDFSALTEEAHKQGTLIVAATDLLALTLLKPPGEWGADIAIGSAQRFGVPMGFGGPHAAFMSCKPEFTRKLPGRIIGISKDALGNPALRLAIQTREQHIRREKATSNICTAQALLAIMASMYAVYHGPEGLKAIARRVHSLTRLLHSACLGHTLAHNQPYFDTLVLCAYGNDCTNVLKVAAAHGINLRVCPGDDSRFALTLDETTTLADVRAILECLAQVDEDPQYNQEVPDLASLPHERADWENLVKSIAQDYPHQLAPLGLSGEKDKLDSEHWTPENRTSPFLTHPTFNSYHTEHEMLRYITRLQSKDLSLTTSMIPLGSCTMKLNATAEMLPISWPHFANLHPFAPQDQTQGYAELTKQLEQYLAEITGLHAVSLQPNAGSQGEYAGLLTIREFLAAQARSKKQEAGSKNDERNVCLIPTSAHGTNPASAVTAGLTVIPVACDQQGNIDLADLKKKAHEHADRLACIMITYPSTHGVFEEHIKQVCQIVHTHGGLVYMDGANMNAQVGLTSPGEIGADVCHLNLHKTFAIPHGGGGPGIGPIAVTQKLAPFLPTNPLSNSSLQPSAFSLQPSSGPVSAAPFGSASILPISWMYIRMMGEPGLRAASELAILNANYMATRLESHYPILYRGKNNRCAHEFILDCRAFEETANVKVEDIAKRLMDFGFHAPTMSWPVPGTLMFEPTESESKAELDRLCDAMIAIRHEIRAIEEHCPPAEGGDPADNPLKHAPHPAHAVTADHWPHKYSRELAAYPAPWTKPPSGHKFWPPVARIDNPYGDRNLICTCAPLNETKY